MKKVMFLLAVTSVCSVAMAQRSNDSTKTCTDWSTNVMEVPVDKYKVETNRFFDNWFISIGGGAQVLLGDESDLGKFRKRIAPTLQVAVGKWFTPGLGLRLQYSGLQAKSFSSSPSVYSKPQMLREGYYQDKFNYMNLHGDILFNVSNMLAGYNPDRVYDFVPFLGFGFAHSYDTPHRNSLTFNFGIINTFHLCKAWDLNLELYGMGAENKFDGKTIDKGMDVMLGATIGVAYTFPKRGFKHVANVDAIMALSAAEIDAINEKLAEEQEKNRELEHELDKTPLYFTRQVTQVVPSIQSIFFKINSSVLPSTAIVNLQQIADMMRKNPSIKLKVTGYADSDTGSAAWNKQLSENRAHHAASVLIECGVNKNNLIVSGMGGVDTLSPPAYNRRVILEAIE